jgi:hypothetical protein
LLLASHFFPLLAKLCLQQEGCYTITSADQDAIDIFEERACEEHFTSFDPNDTYPWNEIRLNQLSRQMATKIANILNP